MITCDYCGESEEFIPIVEKPGFFTYSGRFYLFVNMTNKRTLVCLNCLTFEIEETKTSEGE